MPPLAFWLVGARFLCFMGLLLPFVGGGVFSCELGVEVFVSFGELTDGVGCGFE